MISPIYIGPISDIFYSSERSKQMTDFSHLDALQGRLAREQDRLANAKTENEKNFRIREIAACEKEIANEYKFLGIEPLSLDDILLSDDELLAALSG
jgi:hypothetical protein